MCVCFSGFSTHAKQGFMQDKSLPVTRFVGRHVCVNSHTHKLVNVYTDVSAQRAQRKISANVFSTLYLFPVALALLAQCLLQQSEYTPRYRCGAFLHFCSSPGNHQSDFSHRVDKATITQLNTSVDYYNMTLTTTAQQICNNHSSITVTHKNESMPIDS